MRFLFQPVYHHFYACKYRRIITFAVTFVRTITQFDH